MPKPNHPPETYRGAVHALIPDLSPMVTAAMEAGNIRPHLSDTMSIGPLWMFIYFKTRARVIIHRMEAAPISFTPHSAILFRPGSQYRIDTRPARGLSNHLWMVFDGLQTTPLASLEHGTKGFLTFDDPDLLLMQRLETVVDAVERNKSKPFWAMQSPGRAVLDLLMSAHRESETRRTITRDSAARKQDPLVVRVIEFLHANISKQVRLASLAAHVHASISTTCHRYRTATGEAPMKTLRRLRILRAKQLLVQGNLLADVAEHLGFYDERHLALTFRRSEGMSPRAFVNGSRHTSRSGTTAAGYNVATLAPPPVSPAR